MTDTTYQTRTITSADANSTVVIRSKGQNSDGELGYVTIFADSAHAVSLYDGEDNTGTLIATIPASTVGGTYWLKRPCKKGIAAVVAASFAGSFVVGYN